ncbi:DUF2795 domain-containing protein [Kineococcus indalonis]|uniref:DUF2795 domain-containing protein n=1 Tax=Kineococcus indalonis TaxID=2696566 RepID=UPI0014120A3C|nr:DUF2795 domain-containing protein [Kineococcus indalonis]NAZ88505.1 DUF2795 domain-containing protein [Kineococcus indalonis]
MATTDEVLHAVRDATYPAGKDDLIATAQAAGAGEDVLKALRTLPTEDYANAQEVARSVPTEEEPTDARTAAEQARQNATSRVAAGEREVPPDPTDY